MPEDEQEEHHKFMFKDESKKVEQNKLQTDHKSCQQQPVNRPTFLFDGKDGRPESSLLSSQCTPIYQNFMYRRGSSE